MSFGAEVAVSGFDTFKIGIIAFERCRYPAGNQAFSGHINDAHVSCAVFKDQNRIPYCWAVNLDLDPSYGKELFVEARAGDLLKNYLDIVDSGQETCLRGVDGKIDCLVVRVDKKTEQKNLSLELKDPEWIERHVKFDIWNSCKVNQKENIIGSKKLICSTPIFDLSIDDNTGYAKYKPTDKKIVSQAKYPAEFRLKSLKRLSELVYCAISLEQRVICYSVVGQDGDIYLGKKFGLFINDRGSQGIC